MSEHDDVTPTDADALGSRLRAHFAREAGAVAPRDDWDDLARRIARTDRRRVRALTVALVLALGAGPVLGFAAGRAGRDGGERVAALRRADKPAAGGSGDGAASDPAGLNKVLAGSIGLPGDVPFERLFRRDAGHGIVVRAFRADVSGNGVEKSIDAEACAAAGVPCPLGSIAPPTTWDPPSDCVQVATVDAEVSAEWAVGSAFGSIYRAAPGGLAAYPATFGVAEGEPVGVVVVQAGPEVARVAATFPGGATDEMVPAAGGVAVLAAPVDDDAVTEPATVKVEGLDASGAVVHSVDGTGVFAFRDECEPPPPPPPTLPAPGAEQPADADAARAAVVAAYEQAFDGTRPADERRAAIEGSDRLTDLFDQLATGPFAQQTNDVSARVHDVVFTSATRASVSYDIVIEDYTDFTGRVGEAVLVDGHWKVARATMCNAISLAGVTCPNL